MATRRRKQKTKEQEQIAAILEPCQNAALESLSAGAVPPALPNPTEAQKRYIGLKVFITPNPSGIDDANGVGKVVHAQYRYLPEFGIELVDSPDDADVVAAHIFGDTLGQKLDVLHLHGLYFDGDKGIGNFNATHRKANRRIVEGLRRARVVTMPSVWAGESIRRDMRLTPLTIPNGVDLQLWQSDKNDETETETEQKTLGYVLWNKNRTDDVCDPRPAYELAKAGVPVVSTFAPPEVTPNELTKTMHVTGRVEFDRMVEMVKGAGVYLATTKEVFSLSVLEALAASVPVLGYKWGGTAEVIRHKENGYLVAPGDTAGLVEGYRWLMHPDNYERVSLAARETAKNYEWRAIVEQYAELYQGVYEAKKAEKHRVAVVIPCHNYGKYVRRAIESVLDQTIRAYEIIVVEDGSTDDSAKIIQEYAPRGVKLYSQENRGVAHARNAGIAATDAEYVICLDADDYLHPDYIKTLLPVISTDRATGVVWSKLALVNETGDPTGEIWDFDYLWERQAHPDPDTGAIRNGIPSGAMFRRSMWERSGGYKQVYHPAEDAEFWLRGLSVGFIAKRATDAALFYYRQHGDSASVTKQMPPIHTWHAWAASPHKGQPTSVQYPFGAPASEQPRVKSYSDPVVSVIVPVGDGHEKFLATAIESLLAQDFQEWELIVVDDTRPLMNFELGEVDKIITASYPFVRFFGTAGGNNGAGAARNLGLRHAAAPLVLFLDADDYLLPGALSTLVRRYRDGHKPGGEKFSYVYTDYLAVAGDGKNATIEAKTVPEYDRYGWLNGGLHAVTVLMDTAQARQVGFDPALSGWEDWDFFIRCAIVGYCGKRVPEPLFAYRTSTGQRREQAERLRETLMSGFTEKYEHWFNTHEGKNKLMAKGCCGGNGDPVLAAKGLIAPFNVGASDENSVVLAYTGNNAAPVTYYGTSAKRTYQAGAMDGFNRVTVSKDDAEKLLATGQFQMA